jgi:hypothetical protein
MVLQQTRLLVRAQRLTQILTLAETIGAARTPAAILAVIGATIIFKG